MGSLTVNNICLLQQHIPQRTTKATHESINKAKNCMYDSKKIHPLLHERVNIFSRDCWDALQKLYKVNKKQIVLNIIWLSTRNAAGLF